MDEQASLCFASAFSMPYRMKERFTMKSHAISVNKRASLKVGKNPRGTSSQKVSLLASTVTSCFGYTHIDEHRL